MIDDHITILTASESMDKWLPMMQAKVNVLPMSPLDSIEVAILMGLVEGTAIYLREKAKIIAETQP